MYATAYHGSEQGQYGLRVLIKGAASEASGEVQRTSMSPNADADATVTVCISDFTYK